MEMLDTDPGARYMRGIRDRDEHGGITKFTRAILFDEKIGRTIHIALGQSYPEEKGG